MALAENSGFIDISVVFLDVGVPGTATPRQMEAVERLVRTRLDFELSMEQASMVLTARDYAHGMLLVRQRDRKSTTDDQILMIVATITNDTSLMQYVWKWGRNRHSRGSGEPRLRRNQHFETIHRAVFGS